jgi:predicted esterase
MVVENQIKVTRHARYYNIGEINDNTKNIWFVLHGYGQLAEEFIKWFDEIHDNNTFIIAPEALSRFYLKDGYGKIGASWMSKEDRENEISDYVNYLDEIYSHFINTGNPQKYKVNALGFSQGASTLSRWAALGISELNKIIFWAGELAKEVDYKKLNDNEIHLVFGNNDPIFPEGFYKTQEELLDSYGVKYKTHIFEGKHEINTKLVKEIIY